MNATDTQTTERFDPTEWYEPPGDSSRLWRRVYTGQGRGRRDGWSIEFRYFVDEYEFKPVHYFDIEGHRDDRTDVLILPADLPPERIVQIARMNHVLPPKIGGDDE